MSGGTATATPRSDYKKIRVYKESWLGEEAGMNESCTSLDLNFILECFVPGR